VTVATVNRDLATLRRLLNVALEWKVIETVPKIRLLNGEKNRERVLTHDEEAAYLAVASPLLQDYAILALDTGMGPQELLDTRYENVHFEPAGDAQYGYVHVPVGKAEKRKRNLPMTQRVRKVLSERYASAGQPKWGWVFQGKSEAPVTYDTIDCQHDRVMKKLFQGEELELNRWRLYDMRHTYLTRLGESNADAFTIKKLAGHASILTSQRYVHPTDDRVEGAITRLEAYNAAKRERTKTA
jgi:integrase